MIKDKYCELSVLGSGTGVPSARRASPGLLLRMERKNILLDSSMGTLQRLVKIGITYNNIDYILYSHLHPDHTLDLVSFLFAAKNPLRPRRKDIEIIGPEGFGNFYNKLLEVYGATILPESYKVIIKEAASEVLDFKIWSITARPLPHSDKSIGFRIQSKSGRVISYSGDTDYCSNIIELGKDADLLILECSFPDPLKVKGHLTPSFAGKIAAESKCKKLLLTHLYPICDKFPVIRQCRRYFKGEIILAEDFLRLKIF